MSGFEEFYKHMVETHSFNLKEFINFMEPRFATAGYREKSQLTGGNVLILTEGAAGDFISTTGAIREIRRIYPDARITLLVHPRTLELAECCPHVDEIILESQDIPNNSLQLIYAMNLKTASVLLEQRFDICFAFAIWSPTLLSMYMSGAKVRVTSVNHTNLDNVKNPDTPLGILMQLATHLFPCSTLGTHNADDSFSLIENLIHLPITNRKLEVWYTPADIALVKSHLRNASTPLYALCMGGSGFPKRYPPEKYARLLEMILSEEPTATFVIVGGQNDLSSAAIIRDVAPAVYANNVVDLTGKLDFRRSGAALSLCDAYIGNEIVLPQTCQLVQPIYRNFGILTACRASLFSPPTPCPNAKIVNFISHMVALRVNRTALRRLSRRRSCAVFTC